MSRFLYVVCGVCVASQGWAVGVSSTMPWANAKIPPEQRIKFSQQYMEAMEVRLDPSPDVSTTNPWENVYKPQKSAVDYWHVGDAGQSTSATVPQ
ncbi:MAG: hypothetical protein WAZ18_06395 [Alphaproteobacteria bacterium]